MTKQLLIYHAARFQILSLKKNYVKNRRIDKKKTQGVPIHFVFFSQSNKSLPFENYMLMYPIN